MRLRFGRRRLKPVVKLLIGLVLILVVFSIINSYITPVVNLAVTSKVKSLALQSINSAVYEELNQEGIDYNDFVNISKSADNQVLAVSANSAKINKFKSAVISKTSENLNQNSVKNIEIPLGTLLGSNIFSGRGPNIPIKVAVLGNINTELKSDFTSVGINQTKHRIYLDISVRMSITLANYDRFADVNTSVLVAETIIVGSVPEVFASSESSKNVSAADLAKLNE